MQFTIRVLVKANLLWIKRFNQKFKAWFKHISHRYQLTPILIIHIRSKCFRFKVESNGMCCLVDIMCGLWFSRKEFKKFQWVSSSTRKLLRRIVTKISLRRIEDISTWDISDCIRRISNLITQEFTQHSSHLKHLASSSTKCKQLAYLSNLDMKENKQTENRVETLKLFFQLFVLFFVVPLLG